MEHQQYSGMSSTDFVSMSPWIRFWIWEQPILFYLQSFKCKVVDTCVSQSPSQQTIHTTLPHYSSYKHSHFSYNELIFITWCCHSQCYCNQTLHWTWFFVNSQRENFSFVLLFVKIKQRTWMVCVNGDFNILTSWLKLQ